MLILGAFPLQQIIGVEFLMVPSNWRILLFTLFAIYSLTLSGTLNCKFSAFRLIMAMRVSKSGGWISAVNPHSNRVLNGLPVLRYPWEDGQT